MAEPSTKRKTKGKTRSAGVARTVTDPESLQSGEPVWLRKSSYPRSERRFPPRSGFESLLGILLSSAGAILAGAGVFSQFIRAAGPHSYALYLLIGGVVLFGAGVFLSSRAVPPVRVGDAGVALERAEDSLERLAWHEIESISLASGVLTFRGAGRSIAMPIAAHPEASARASIEARSRIPARTGQLKDELKPPPRDAGEQVKLDAPQLAGLHCKASKRLIAFENDARLCGRCEETYHKDSVPPRCLSCDARLT